jgi:Spy/CpxP family protein refolding chaperone
MKTNRLAIVVCSLQVLACNVALAQTDAAQGKRSFRGTGTGPQGMRGMPPGSPDFGLRQLAHNTDMQGKVGLNSSQVDMLQQLETKVQASTGDRGRQLWAKQMELRQLMRSKTQDPTTLEAKRQEVQTLRDQQRKDSLAIREAMSSILTPEQMKTAQRLQRMGPPRGGPRGPMQDSVRAVPPERP